MDKTSTLGATNQYAIKELCIYKAFTKTSRLAYDLDKVCNGRFCAYLHSAL